VQHQDNRDKLKGQPISSKIIDEESLINLIKSMPYTHFTSDERNELAALLRAKVKKEEYRQTIKKA
jgi:hypothetical protein